MPNPEDRIFLLYQKAGNNIDEATFDQILEMDEDEEEREFSKPLVFDFFEQANVTFDEIEQGIETKDLKLLSDKGHFLKGSSATLGLTRVKDSCEKIQHYGARKNDKGDDDPKFNNDDFCVRKIREVLGTMKKDLAEVQQLLEEFYSA